MLVLKWLDRSKGKFDTFVFESTFVCPCVVMFNSIIKVKLSLEQRTHPKELKITLKHESLLSYKLDFHLRSIEYYGHTDITIVSSKDFDI